MGNNSINVQNVNVCATQTTKQCCKNKPQSPLLIKPQHNQEKTNTALMPVILISYVRPQRSSHSPAVHKKLVCLCTTLHILMCVRTPERTRHTLQASLILAHLRGIARKTCCLLKRQSSLIFLLCIVPAEGKKKAGQSLWESSEACSDHKPLKQVFLPPDTVVWSVIFQPISDNYRATCSHTRQSLMSLRDGLPVKKTRRGLSARAVCSPRQSHWEWKTIEEQSGLMYIQHTCEES